MQARVGSTDRAFLHGLTTRTDGLSVVFSPSSACKACGEEIVNRTKLHSHNCQRGGGAWARCATCLGFEEASGPPMVFKERKLLPVIFEH